jgi:hypothetical protein
VRASWEIPDTRFPSGEERRFSPQRTPRARRQRPSESESGLRSDDHPGMDLGGARHEDIACSKMRDAGSIASLVFSAFFSAFSASSAVRNEWIAALPRWGFPSAFGVRSASTTSSSASARRCGPGPRRVARRAGKACGLAPGRWTSKGPARSDRGRASGTPLHGSESWTAFQQDSLSESIHLA